jgi:NAD(P)-dependent dehydrogenase (short-subunit alcohol dehydrogenase family)
VRTVVVGASSGLGRCIAVGLARRGDHVAVLARRYDMLVEAAEEEAGPELSPSSATSPTRNPAATPSAEAADGLGGIDALVYTPAIGPLKR